MRVCGVWLTFGSAEHVDLMNMDSTAYYNRKLNLCIPPIVRCMRYAFETDL